MGEEKLKFVPFVSNVTPSFWYKLVDLKLNKFKLDDTDKPIQGTYNDIVNISQNKPCEHNIDFDAFDTTVTRSRNFVTHGALVNKNTIEDFKCCNKTQILTQAAGKIWEDIKTGSAIKDPSLLVRFILLTFADLKKYNFYYWFGYPSFINGSNLTISKKCQFFEQYGDYKVSLQTNYMSFSEDNKHNFFFMKLDSNQDVSFHPLHEFEASMISSSKIMFGFSDPSPMPNFPGWPMRNFLNLILYHWIKDTNTIIRVCCLRTENSNGKTTLINSLYFEVNCKPHSDESMPETTGWEKNHQGKFGPKYVNLAENMDPVKLAESSTSLNLRLMKWRLLPQINLEEIAKQKCLLLGSGTLGCNVSRALLSWGVKHITFVDNGTVSFSNPVRQTLFEFSDCQVTGGAYKALAAAEKLKKIYPGSQSAGHVLSIPMPGHPVNSTEKYSNQAKQDTMKIIELVNEHDVIFLLTDSRESRWLPTVIASAEHKLVITAALGFDSYLVMRHGIATIREEKLGCYFCNDVVAPGNSLKDRTLDQQCTVSRPGLSLIASALAVELCVSVIQHPDKARHIPSVVSSESDYTGDRDELPLGPIPHQIRGFLSQFHNLLPTTFSFTKCTACSESIVNAYKKDGLDFLMKVFNSPGNYLEDLTGLTELHKETSFAENDILEFSDDESI